MSLALAPDRSSSCTDLLLGGKLEQLRGSIRVEFAAAKEIAWRVGKISLVERDAINLIHVPGRDSIAMARDSSVIISDFMIISSLHAAVMHAFTRAIPEMSDPVFELGFMKLMLRNTRAGRITDFFPYYVGLSVEECFKYFRDPGLQLPNSIEAGVRSLLHFVFLHEIGHIVLKHSVDVAPSRRWEQEFQADEWALETLQMFYGDLIFAADSEILLLSTDTFAHGDILDDQHLSLTHPPSICRKLRVTDFAIDRLEYINDAEFNTLTLIIKNNLSLFRNYFIRGIERNSIKCQI